MNAQKLIDNFSTHLKNVIARGISLASYLKHPHVEPAHLLIALGEESGSVAADILKKCAIDSAQLRDFIAHEEQLIKIKKEDVARGNQLLPDLSMGSRLALEKALVLAYERSHTYIGTEHLLYGIVNARDTLVEKIFIDAHVEYAKIQEQLENSLQNSSHFSHVDDVAEALGDMGPLAAPVPHHETHKQTSALDFFTVELTGKYAEEHIDPVIGREQEIDRIIHILARRTKNNPILVGEPGVGKTAIVEGLAKKISRGDVPDILKRKKILSLDLTMLIAGTIYRGEFEARLKQIVDEVSESNKYILFIDELHNIIGAGSNQGTMDAANILKPALARGLLRCIGATTYEEYKKYVASDPALERRFQEVQVEEPSPEETLAILEGVKKYYEQFHGVTITPEALTSAVELSNRYIHEQFQPDKSLDLIDEAAAAVRTRQKQTSYQEKHGKLIDERDRAEHAKEQAIQEERLQDALVWKNREAELENKIGLLEKQEKKDLRKRPDVTKDDVIKTASVKLHIDEHVIAMSEWENLDTLESRLKKHIIGQDAVIAELTRSLKRSYLSTPSRGDHPFASLLSVGPSGVGKTELAKRLAEELYHDKKALIKLDMSEFAEAHSVSKILGSPAGYIGYNERNMIVDEIRRRPYSVILFDEIDKAHRDVVRLLLQILDEGQLTDSRGKKVYFNQSIIMMTTNLGAELFKSASIGFGSVTTKAGQREVDDAVMKKIKEELGAALLSRIGTTLIFHPLTRADISVIVQRHVEEVNRYLTPSQNVSVTADAVAIQHLIKKAYTPDFGARNIERTVQHVINELVVNILKKKQHKKHYTLTADKENYALR